MKHFILAAALGLMATTASAAQIDPATTNFPWVNGPTRDSQYRLTDVANVNKVHVFEVFSLSCSWCNRNAEQVKALAAAYSQDARVQFIDLGLDTSDAQYRTWISRHQPTYPVVKDVGRKVYSALMSENGIPQTFVVACDGKLAGQTIGYWGNEEIASLKRAIDQAKETTCD